MEADATREEREAARVENMKKIEKQKQLELRKFEEEQHKAKLKMEEDDKLLAKQRVCSYSHNTDPRVIISEMFFFFFFSDRDSFFF